MKGPYANFSSLMDYTHEACEKILLFFRNKIFMTAQIIIHFGAHKDLIFGERHGYFLLSILVGLCPAKSGQEGLSVYSSVYISIYFTFLSIYLPILSVLGWALYRTIWTR